MCIRDRSISGGNSVTLPVGVGKEFVVTSDTEGVVVTKTEADATTTYNVNLDNALDKYYKKAETYTKKEVDNLLTNQENKATDLTVYRGCLLYTSLVNSLRLSLLRSLEDSGDVTGLVMMLVEKVSSLIVTQWKVMT